MALGEARVRALGASVGELDGAEQLLLETIAALLVELFVGVAELGERVGELLDRRGDGIEQALLRVGGRVRHSSRVFTCLSHGGNRPARDEAIGAWQRGSNRVRRGAGNGEQISSWD